MSSEPVFNPAGMCLDSSPGGSRGEARAHHQASRIWVGLVLEASSAAGSCQHQHPPGSAPLILLKASEGGKKIKIKKHEHKFVSILPEGAAFARQLSTGRRGRLLSPINLQAPGPARKETARISERRGAAPPTNVSSRKINHGETKQPPAEHDEMRDTR